MALKQTADEKVSLGRGIGRVPCICSVGSPLGRVFERLDQTRVHKQGYAVLLHGEVPWEEEFKSKELMMMRLMERATRGYTTSKARNVTDLVPLPAKVH